MLNNTMASDFTRYVLGLLLLWTVLEGVAYLICGSLEGQ